MSRLCRVLLVADDCSSTAALRRDLDSIGFDVSEVRSGSPSIAAARTIAPDLILVDCRARSDLGLQLCRSLRSTVETATIPLVVLAPPLDPGMRLAALEAGADEVLTEAIVTREAMLRMRALVRRGEQAASRQLLTFADIELDLSRYRVRRRGQPVELTASQIRLLRHFMEHPGTVFSCAALARTVWKDAAVDEGAVKACVIRLRKALNATGGASLIRNVRGVGYLLDDEAVPQPATGDA